MKMLARSCVWWPEIDKDITFNSCKTCQFTQNSNPAGHSQWPETKNRMDRIYMDFGQYKGNLYLVIIDAYSRWLEIYLVKSTSLSNHIHSCKTCQSTQKSNPAGHSVARNKKQDG
jgi:hypothetical protein